MPFYDLAIEFKFRYLRNLGNTIIDFFSQVKGLFGTFGIVDAVDIFVVAVIVFAIIRVVRETRAIQLIKGMLFLVFFYFLLNFFGLGASSYILRLIFSNILIILVILFGPEIRNILEQMGLGNYRKAFKNFFNSGVALDIADMKKAIDGVCKACAEMSDDNIGALIVFENDTLLGDIIQSGTIIDGRCTKELIGNIFYPKSPLHDGAMVIRKDSVYAAGCILPLTNSNDISSKLGTRHRAAIGITEQSDAIAIVVSEETGAISYAINGTLTQDVSTGELRDVLTKQYIVTGSTSDEKIVSRIARRFKNNEQ